MDEPLPVSDIETKRSEPQGAFPGPRSLREHLTTKNLVIAAGILTMGILAFRSTKPDGPKPHQKAELVAAPVVQTQPQVAQNTDQSLQAPPVTVAGQQSISQAPAQAPQDVQKTINDQLAEQRRSYEMKAAFETNVVSGGHSVASTVSTIAAPLETASVPTPTPAQTTPVEQKDKLEFDHNQPLYWLPESTVIEGVLDSEVQGQMSGPVDAHITTNVYQQGTRILLLPQGTRLVGESSKVGGMDQSRLAVIFHRMLVYPPLGKAIDPYSIPLDHKLPGLDQRGAAGVTGHVNNHMMSLLGAAAVVGLIQGASVATYSGGSGNISIGMMNGLSQSTSEVTSRILERFLNRLPTITIPAGTRIKFELIQDVQVPAFPGSLTNDALRNLRLLSGERQ